MVPRLLNLRTKMETFCLKQGQDLKASAALPSQSTFKVPLHPPPPPATPTPTQTHFLKVAHCSLTGPRRKACSVCTLFLFVCSGTQSIISIKGFGITACDQLHHRNTIFALKKSYHEPFLFCKRNDKSMNQDNYLNKNCVSNSTLNPPNLNPKFPSLPKMRGFKIAALFSQYL